MEKSVIMKNTMILKRWNLLRLLPALFTFLLLSGCTKVQDDETIESGYAMIDANIRTYAASASSDPNTRGAAEYAIRRVRLYAFDGDKLDNMMYVDAPASGETGEINMRMEVRKTTGKTLYVIVNEPTDAALQNRLTMINNPAAFAELQYAMADYFTDAQKAFNSDAKFEAADFCLPMSGKLANVNTVSDADIPVTLPVTRSLARVDVLVQKYPSAPAITIQSTTKLEIVGTRTKGFVFGERTASGQSGDLIDVADAAIGSAAGQTVPDGKIGNNKAAIRVFSFYTPERDCTGNKLGFRLNGVNYDGITKNYEVKIGNEEDAMLEKIERNKVYRIYCTFAVAADSDTDVEVEILDWDDVSVKGDIGDWSLFVVDKSNVKIDFAAPGPYSAQVKFFASQNVSFVGYVIKNDDGTDKSTSTDGSNLPAWLPKGNITGLPDNSTELGTISLTGINTSDALSVMTLRLKSGTLIRDITVSGLNFGAKPEEEPEKPGTSLAEGFLSNDVLKANGWPEASLTPKGIQLAKRGNVKSGTAGTDQKVYWQSLDMMVGEVPDARQSGLGFGPSNTSAIISALGKNGPAANVCRDLGADWYLPSADELNYIFVSLGAFGPDYAFESNMYWSSTEVDEQSCYVLFSAINQIIKSTKHDEFYVRCVRNF